VFVFANVPTGGFFATARLIALDIGVGIEHNILDLISSKRSKPQSIVATTGYSSIRCQPNNRCAVLYLPRVKTDLGDFEFLVNSRIVASIVASKFNGWSGDG
jgi:hypothetical protein